MSGGISVSKLKSELRQAQRLLSRNDKLNASLRVETERRVESLKSQIAEEQQRRGAEEAVQPTPERVKAANDQDGNAAAGFGAGGAESALEASKPAPKKKKTAKEEKYKMLRHVEFKKSSRRLKQAERDLASVVSQIQSIPEDDSKTNRKARKTLEKEKSQAEIKREHARIDAWYGSVSILDALRRHAPFRQANAFCLFCFVPCRPFRHSISTLPCTLLASTSNSGIYPHLPNLLRRQKKSWNCMSKACHQLANRMMYEATGVQ